MAIEKKKPNLRYQRDKDRELVTGIFQYHELRGGELKFRIKLYKEDPIEKFELTDGKVYKLPLTRQGLYSRPGKRAVYSKRSKIHG